MIVYHTIFYVDLYLPHKAHTHVMLTHSEDLPFIPAIGMTFLFVGDIEGTIDREQGRVSWEIAEQQFHVSFGGRDTVDEETLDHYLANGWS